MRTLLAGPAYLAGPGDTLDLPDAFARALIAGGFAEPAKDASVETAEASAPERAVADPLFETAEASAPEHGVVRRRKRAH